ncbi:MAG: hypothetical protein ACYC64_04280 [Armatimonadota bacterium]
MERKRIDAYRAIVFSLLTCLLVFASAAVLAQTVPPTIYYYDVTFASGLPAAQRYDVYHTTACLQGLANREAPRMFIKYYPNGNGGGDQEWLNRLGETGGLCEGWFVQSSPSPTTYGIGQCNTASPPGLVGWTLGYRFTVGSKPIIVTQLGAYDYGSNGLSAPIPVTIWNADGSAIVATTSIPSGTAQDSWGLADTYGRYVFKNISPMTLNAGTTYVIGAYSSGTNDYFSDWSQVPSFVEGPDITVDQARNWGGNTFPIGVVAGHYMYGGPNFTYETLDQRNAELFDRFGSHARGLVLYDSDPSTGVISTSLVATTAAACENAIAVRKDTTPGSMYDWLVNIRNYPVLIDLTGKFTGSGTIWQTATPSTGSAKCDAYIWAKEKYLDTGRCDPAILSYSLDLFGLQPGNDIYTSLSNLDYAVSKKGFCFELSPWGDEVATDDPTQPLGTDLNTYKQILNACNVQTNYGKMIKVCGFLNWDKKYTNATGVGGTHEPVATEWEMMRIHSAYNAYGEPDAPDPRCFANASFYSALLPEVHDRRYVQNPPPTYSDMVARGLIDGGGNIVPGNYVLLGLGDYDAPSWTMYLALNGLYSDPARGQRYCTWGVNPNLIDRMSAGIDYMFRHKTSKDYFMAWDSGAGYVQPQQLYGTRSPSGYTSGVPVWQAHCREYYRPLDYSISGWLLNGASPFTITDYQNYTPFSGDGIGAHVLTSPTALVNNVPCNAIRDDMLDWDAGDTARVMNFASGVNFGWYRTIMWTPTQIMNLEDYWANSGNNHRFLDAYTYYYLLRYYLSGQQQSSNYYRATWVGDTIPRVMAAGHTYPVTVTVRNDGWDTWTEASLYRLGHAIVAQGLTPSYSDYDVNPRHYLPGGATVAPGQSVTFSFNITAPSTVGSYDLYYDVVRDGVSWFRDQNNIEWKRAIIVATYESDVDTDSDLIADVTENANGGLYWDPDDGTAPLADPYPPTGSVIINSEATYCTTTSVTLAISATDQGRGVTRMRVGNSLSTMTTWESYATSKSWTLTSGDGVKNVYVQFKDAAGNISEVYSDSITVDTTSPIPGTSTPPASVTTGTILVNYSGASDSGSGINKVELWYKKESAGAWANSGLIQTGVSGSFTFTPSDGSGRYYFDLAAQDNAGNRSAAVSGSGDGVTIFKLWWSDGFESGNFTTGGWTNSGCTITSAYKYSGTYAAVFNSSDSLTKSYSTSGKSSIIVEYARYARTMEVDDHFISEWSINGSTWTTLEDLTGNSTWTVKSYSLPSGADNQSGFRIRFRTSHNGSTDYAYVDDVKIIGL